MYGNTGNIINHCQANYVKIYEARIVANNEIIFWVETKKLTQNYSSVGIDIFKKGTQFNS